MTPLTTSTTTSASAETDDLARLAELERHLGRKLGRPSVIEHLGVTDARARKLIAARNDDATTSPHHHQLTAGASTLRHLAPAEPTTTSNTTTSHHQVMPAGEDHHQPPPPEEDSPTQDDAPNPQPRLQVVKTEQIPGSIPQPTADTAETTNTETNNPTPAADHADTPHTDPPTAGQPSPDGAAGFYLVAFLALLVSVNTSWRFFGQVLHITNLFERIVMFSVLEAALIACGTAMRAAVRRSGRPGPARWVAWTLCGLSAYMALMLSGPFAGAARVALGPLLSLTMLHLALGIEIRAKRGTRATTWARIGHELRERALSRLGLSNDQRDALAHTRDRAARRAARLASAHGIAFRRARLARALRIANVAHETPARSRMLAELATAKHANQLRHLTLPSPWTTEPDQHDQTHTTPEGAPTP